MELRNTLVLRQDIVSTPGAECHCDAVQKDGDNQADAVIHVRKPGFESLEGGAVVQEGQCFGDVRSIPRSGEVYSMSWSPHTHC